MTTPFADHSAVCRSQHCEMNMRGRWVTIIVAPRFNPRAGFTSF
jgi:hypothetical protein